METLTRTRTQRINYYVNQLKKEQPEELEKELRYMYARTLLTQFKDTVLPNNITMEDIVSEVQAYRKERNEKKNRI
ncbi:MAG: hypothetical protein LBV31_03265 [Prevotellaceae bacterium]|nr:hypothetical protein [Prevotellaceae bacterium]